MTVHARIAQLIESEIQEAVRRERERAADISYTQPTGPFTEDDVDQALLRLRLAIGDAIIGTNPKEHGE